MGIVTGFTHDLFVSYANYDDKEDSQGVRWVTRFQSDLQGALRQRLGRDVDIYFDAASLRSADPVDLQLESARHSAIFLPVVSPSYFASKSPIRELEAFSAGGANAERIVPVEFLPVEMQRVHPLLRDRRRTQFWTQTGRTTALPVTPKFHAETYHERLADLSDQLARILVELNKLNREARASPRPSPAPSDDAIARPQQGRKIFICYRRDDSAGTAGRVHDWLEREFGRDLLFMDVDSIRLGVNFVKALQEEVGKCNVLLAVIGRSWLDVRDDDGNRRLDDPNDFVRVEIATALQRDIPVIPILIEGTKVPKALQLPEDLRELALRNGMEIRHAAFKKDMETLIEELTAMLR